MLGTIGAAIIELLLPLGVLFHFSPGSQTSAVHATFLLAIVGFHIGVFLMLSPPFFHNVALALTPLLTSLSSFGAPAPVADANTSSVNTALCDNVNGF